VWANCKPIGIFSPRTSQLLLLALYGSAKVILLCIGFKWLLGKEVIQLDATHTKFIQSSLSQHVSASVCPSSGEQYDVQRQYQRCTSYVVVHYIVSLTMGILMPKHVEIKNAE
jgi:hypothetical protein